MYATVSRKQQPKSFFNRKFTAFKESILSKFESLKGVLSEMAPFAAVGAVALAGGIGIEEIRQSMEISKELIIIGLADVAALIGIVGYIKSH